MKRTAAWVIPAFIAAFFCSGAAGLGYQVLWAKAFSAGLGHEYPAALAVVTAFMAGLAIGAGAFGWLPVRLRQSPKLYGFLELLIAVWGVGSVWLVPAANHLTIHLLGIEPSFARHWTVVFFVTMLVLLPATAAMGATLPAVERLLAGEMFRNRVGRLYAANTAGALAGALAGAFWAMPAFGIKGSILFFAGCNFVCGVAALLLASRVDSRAGQAPSPVPFGASPNDPRRASLHEIQRAGAPAGTGEGACPPHIGRYLFATGLLGIGFEAIAIRALSHVLENTVFTFAVVLAVYLLGTALGAALLTKLRERVLFLALGGACLVSGILLRWTPALYLNLRESWSGSLGSVAAAECLVAAAVLLMPAFFMGAAFSRLAKSSLARRDSLSRAVALNSAGAALGPILFGLLIIPQLGLRAAVALVAAGYLLLSGGRTWWLALGVLPLFTVLSGSKDLVLRDRDESIIFHRDGLIASVTVLEGTNGARVLKVNNRFQMGGTEARIGEARHADIPLLLHPHPRSALFIGLGTGITFATAANYPGLHADGVELLPEVVEAMPLFQVGGGDLSAPNLRVHLADGRRFVLAGTNFYDVIVGDLFHPAQDGAAFLYSREHFAAIHARLNASGLFCQWLPLYQMNLRTFDIVAGTFRSVFPNGELWLLRFNVDTPVAGLIGWKDRAQFTSEMVETKAASSEKLREHLRTVALGDTLRLLGGRVGPLAPRPAPLNTDDRPIVLFEAPRLGARLRDDPGARLLELLDRHPPQSDLGVEVERYAKARNIYLRGLEEESRGSLEQGVRLYIESARVSSEFTSGYAQALGIAAALAPKNREAAESILRQLMEAQPERPVARQLLERLR